MIYKQPTIPKGTRYYFLLFICYITDLHTITESIKTILSPKISQKSLKIWYIMVHFGAKRRIFQQIFSKL